MEGDTEEINMTLEKLINIGGTFMAGTVAGYAASHYYPLEAVNEMIINNPRSSALIGCFLLSSPLLLAAGMMHYIGKELKKYKDENQ